MNRYQKLKLPPNKFQTFLKLALAHKIGLVIIGIIFVFVAGSVGVREKFVSSLSANQTSLAFNGINPVPVATNFTDPNLASPSATESPSPTDDTVLGDSVNNSTYTPPAPVPSYSSLPTPTPLPTITPTTTTQSTYYNNGNVHCTSAPGLANWWYSEAESSGTSITVSINDCQKNLAKVSDRIKVCVTSDAKSTSCSSNDSSAQINGQSLPTDNIVSSGGSVTFNVTSQISGTDYFYLYDESNGFVLTNSNNQNPGITFSGSTSTPSPPASSAASSSASPSS